MYPVSNDYLDQIKRPYGYKRTLRGTIGDIAFTDEDILSGSLTISNQCSDSGEVQIGFANVGMLEATFRDELIERTEWQGKTITLSEGLYIERTSSYEYVPLGVYVVDNGFVAAKAFSLSDNLGRLLENQIFIELTRRGYDTDKTMFYYRSRNDKEVDFVLRKGPHIERLVQVCYDMSSPKTEKREVDSLIECAGELKCDNLVIVTKDDERTIEKDGYKIDLVPLIKF